MQLLRIRTPIRGVMSVIAVVAPLTVGCMGAFDIVVPSKSLPGNFRLIRFEGENYYIEQLGREEAGGVLKGTVDQLGWSANYIIGRRNAISSALQSGWMIIGVEGNEIKGPFTDAEFAEAVRQDSSLASIKIWPVDEAWEKLG